MSKQWGHGYHEGRRSMTPRIVLWLKGLWNMNRQCGGFRQNDHGRDSSGGYWCQRRRFHFGKCRDVFGNRFDA